MKNLNPTIILIALAVLFYTSHFGSIERHKKNLAVIQRIFENFARGNVPAVLANLDPKVEWNEAESFIYGNNKALIGPDAVVNEVFMKTGTEWNGFTITNLQLINMAGGMVLAMGPYQGQYRKNAAAVDTQMAHIWTLNDGKSDKLSAVHQYKTIFGSSKEINAC